MTGFFTSIRRAVVAGGLIPYEISAAARPGFRSAHNMVYWTGLEYLALGAGAHGFRRTESGAVRWSNERNANRYMAACLAGQPVSDTKETLTADDVLEDLVMTGLRMDEGIPVSDALRGRFGAAAERLKERGLLIEDGPRWRATNAGRLVLDQVVFQLLT